MSWWNDKKVSDTDVKIIYNLNFGYLISRCILPYGLGVEIDLDNKMITIKENVFRNDIIYKVLLLFKYNSDFKKH